MALSLAKRSESSLAAVPVVPVVVAGSLLTGASAPLSERPPLNGKMYLHEAVRKAVTNGACGQLQGRLLLRFCLFVVCLFDF